MFLGLFHSFFILKIEISCLYNQTEKLLWLVNERKSFLNHNLFFNKKYCVAILWRECHIQGLRK